MSPTLPPSLIAKLSPLCRWRGCTAQKADGADYCAPHHEKQKGYQRKSMKRRNDARDSARECRACGGKLPARWNSTRCRRCQREQAETAKSSRLKDAAHRLKNARRDPAPQRGYYKTEVYSDGATRTRFVGQSHRGGPTRQEQDSSAARLVSNVVAHGQSWLDERIEKQAEIDTLPRIQRAAGRQLRGDELAYLGRLLIQAAADYGSAAARDMLRKLEAEEG